MFLIPGQVGKSSLLPRSTAVGNIGIFKGNIQPALRPFRTVQSLQQIPLYIPWLLNPEPHERIYLGYILYFYRLQNLTLPIRLQTTIGNQILHQTFLVQIVPDSLYLFM